MKLIEITNLRRRFSEMNKIIRMRLIRCTVILIALALLFVLLKNNHYSRVFEGLKSSFDKMRYGKEAFYLNEFENDKEYLESVVENLKGMDTEGKMVKIIRDKRTMADYGLSREMARKYGVTRIAVEYPRDEDNYLVYFSTSVHGYEYANIYYSANDEPDDSIYLGKYDEEREMFVDENYSYDSYTYKISDNWFFFKQHWKH